MALKQAFILVASVWLVAGQRPSFAGSKPIGFPEVVKPTDSLGNRFGDDTPLVLPLEARGDRDLVERISKLPIDQQPFWYINWKALEDLRKNPVTYQQRPSSFTDEGVLAASQNVSSSDLTSKFGTNNQNSNNPNVNNPNPNNQNLNNPNANNQNLNNPNVNNQNLNYPNANNQNLNNQNQNNQNLNYQNASNQTPSNAQDSRRNYRNSNRHNRRY